MAKETIKQDPQVDLSQTVTVTAADLLQLFATLQQNAAESSKTQNQALIDGLKQLSPHYIPPGQEENIKQQRAAQRKIEVFKIKNLRRQQRNCDHEVGQTGRKRNGEGAFAGLKLCTGETIGVCFYCGFVISSINPEHQKYFKKINGTVAQSGQIEGMSDPIKSQLARLSEDDQKKVLASRSKYFSEKPAEEELDEDLELVN